MLYCTSLGTVRVQCVTPHDSSWTPAVLLVCDFHATSCYCRNTSPPPAPPISLLDICTIIIIQKGSPVDAVRIAGPDRLVAASECGMRKQLTTSIIDSRGGRDSGVAEGGKGRETGGARSRADEATKPNDETNVRKNMSLMAGVPIVVGGVARGTSRLRGMGGKAGGQNMCSFADERRAPSSLVSAFLRAFGGAATAGATTKAGLSTSIKSATALPTESKVTKSALTTTTKSLAATAAESSTSTEARTELPTGRSPPASQPSSGSSPLRPSSHPILPLITPAVGADATNWSWAARKAALKARNCAGSKQPESEREKSSTLLARICQGRLETGRQGFGDGRKRPAAAAAGTAESGAGGEGSSGDNSREGPKVRGIREDVDFWSAGSAGGEKNSGVGGSVSGDRSEDLKVGSLAAYDDDNDDYDGGGGGGGGGGGVGEDISDENNAVGTGSPPQCLTSMSSISSCSNGAAGDDLVGESPGDVEAEFEYGGDDVAGTVSGDSSMAEGRKRWEDGGDLSTDSSGDETTSLVSNGADRVAANNDGNELEWDLNYRMGGGELRDCSRGLEKVPIEVCFFFFYVFLSAVQSGGLVFIWSVFIFLLSKRIDLKFTHTLFICCMTPPNRKISVASYVQPLR